MSAPDDEAQPVKRERRYDVDWLRVILFGLLLPFHVAIGVYVDAYDFVLPDYEEDEDKSRDSLDQEAGEDAANVYTSLGTGVLGWMHEWRIAALFMISGMGTAFAFKRRTWKIFLKERTKRLLIPMIAGIWTITPITWMIVLRYFPGSILEGMAAFLGFGIVMTFMMIIPLLCRLLALGHLWFIWSLLQYSIILIPIFSIVRNNPDGRISRAIKGVFKMPFRMGPLLILPLFLTISDLLFKPLMGEAIGFGYEWPWYLLTFLFGYMFIIAKDQYFEFIDNSRIQITIATVIFTIAFFWMRVEEKKTGIPYIGGGWVENNDFYHTNMTIISCFVTSFHTWFWCLAIFSWGAFLLNRPSSHLAYLNRGVYPFYIIHQPLVYIGLFFLLREGYSDMTVFLLTTALVVLGCWIFFEAMKRNWVTRMMYGIKEHPKKIEQVQDDTENPPVV